MGAVVCSSSIPLKEPPKHIESVVREWNTGVKLQGVAPYDEHIDCCCKPDKSKTITTIAEEDEEDKNSMENNQCCANSGEDECCCEGKDSYQPYSTTMVETFKEEPTQWKDNFDVNVIYENCSCLQCQPLFSIQSVECDCPDCSPPLVRQTLSFQESIPHRVDDKCSLCKYFAGQHHKRWVTLDEDVTVVMDAVRKLTTTRTDDHKLQKRKRIGLSLQRMPSGSHALVIRDGLTTYNIELANPPDDQGTKEEGDSDEKTNGTKKDGVTSGTENGQQSPKSGTVLVRRMVSRYNQIRRSIQEGDNSTENQIDKFPPVDTAEACEKAASRLRELAGHLQHGDVPIVVLQKTLQYAAGVLEAISMDDARRLMDDEDDLSEVQPDAVPNEVREWLASTFTRQNAPLRKRSEDKPRFRSVANAIRAGIMVDRIYRRMSSSTFVQMPAQVAFMLKNIDDWSFSVFAVNEVATGQVLRYVTYDLLNRYGLIHKYKISTPVLESFLTQIENGYMKYKNPYHNNLHAADVTQTVHYMLCSAGVANWLTDLEIFATIIAAVIHDYEHTGTTNNFHVMSGSETALLYNDRAVLENYHISAAFKILREDDSNILANLSREEYREFRSLVIEMVLSTDMSMHFQQIKTMKSSLTHGDFTIDKTRALSLILHCCDISHPCKAWMLHHRWTQYLIEEFFRQGDMEKALGLPFSPLCDRNTTLVAESQIGFIDFIVNPSMEVCGDLLEKIRCHLLGPKTINPLQESISEEDPVPRMPAVVTTVRSGRIGSAASLDSAPTSDIRMQRSSSSAPPSDRPNLAKLSSTAELETLRPWSVFLDKNRQLWSERAAIDAAQRAAKAKQEEEERAKEGQNPPEESE